MEDAMVYNGTTCKRVRIRASCETPEIAPQWSAPSLACSTETCTAHDHGDHYQENPHSYEECKCLVKLGLLKKPQYLNLADLVLNLYKYKGQLGPYTDGT